MAFIPSDSDLNLWVDNVDIQSKILSTTQTEGHTFDVYDVVCPPSPQAVLSFLSFLE